MRLTYELLKSQTPPACEEQASEFKRLYSDGCEPTVDNLFELESYGLDVFWLTRLLHADGPGSMRAFALWCAEQVAYLSTDQRVTDCLAVVRRRVEEPGNCTDNELAAAGDAAWAAAGDAAWAAAWAAARAAAWDAGAAAGVAARAAAWVAARAAAWDAAGDSSDAQIACLAQLLCEA
jgi:hypothetical protein